MEGFVSLQNVITELSYDREFGNKFETSPDFWDKCKEILEVLKSFYIATKEMQRVGYGLADFYVSWLRIEKNLTRIMAEATLLDLANELMKSLDTRRAELFNTPNMIAAIYLDPRTKYKLTSVQKECAILHLKKLYVRVFQLKNVEIEEQSNGNNTLDELNEEFTTQEGEAIPDEVDVSHLLMALTVYDAVKHVDYKLPVMEFWKRNKDEFSLIYPLACVVHAVPAGQCLEERNFSSFSYIRSARRTRLNEKNVKNILMIRLNKELFYEEKQHQIDAIKYGK